MAKGRPREFDVEQALDKAVEVFWRHGYEGTTLPELTKAMGINRPSLYAAFGNKESLFRKAMDRYAIGPSAHVACALSQPTARAAAERLLYGSAECLTNPDKPKGCLAVQGALSCGESAAAIKNDLASRRHAVECRFKTRFEQAIADGELPAGTNAADLARFISTVHQGLAVQAAGGATHEELRRVVDTALKAWPA